MKKKNYVVFLKRLNIISIYPMKKPLYTGTNCAFVRVKVEIYFAHRSNFFQNSFAPIGGSVIFNSLAH